MLLLPLTNNSEESFNIPILTVIYTFKQLWNTTGFWTLDITDSDGIKIVDGVKIITQEYLLRQYPQVGFDLISYDELDPTRNNLDVFKLGVVSKDV